VSNYIQGLYNPKNPHKYIGDVSNIVFRSSWELRSFKWADETQSIIEWSSEPFPIKYFDVSTNKVRRYFPDLFVRVQESSGEIKTYIIEIKPEKQTRAPKKTGRKKQSTYLQEMATYQKNTSKWKMAEKFCESNNFIFRIITERELGL
jgi:hypothetical protein